MVAICDHLCEDVMEGLNLCYLDGLIHKCSADDWENQKSCSFAERSRFFEHCTHFRFGEFCQNVDAYETAKKD